MKTEIVFSINISHRNLYYIWDVHRKHDSCFIGKVKFEKGNNQYNFLPNGPMIYLEADTLEQIARFLDTQNGTREEDGNH